MSWCGEADAGAEADIAPEVASSAPLRPTPFMNRMRGKKSAASNSRLQFSQPGARFSSGTLRLEGNVDANHPEGTGSVNEENEEAMDGKAALFDFGIDLGKGV